MPVQRIVTLLPSATEIVCALGLRNQLVGITHECDYPPGIEHLPRVTSSTIDPSTSSKKIDSAVRNHLSSGNSLYTLDETLLMELEPDLIVTQGLCEVCAISEEEVLSIIKRLPGNPELINLEPMTLMEVLETISLVGHATHSETSALSCRKALEQRVKKIREATFDLEQRNKPTVGFLEWLNPLFNAGHWTPEIIEYAGGIDSFGNKHQPSQAITDEALIAANPDVLIIALCGFNEERAATDLESLKARIDFNALTAARNNQVYILDGNTYFSRPGPRLVDALELITKLLHPTIANTS